MRKYNWISKSKSRETVLAAVISCRCFLLFEFTQICQIASKNTSMRICTRKIPPSNIGSYLAVTAVGCIPALQIVPNDLVPRWSKMHQQGTHSTRNKSLCNYSASPINIGNSTISSKDSLKGELWKMHHLNFQTLGWTNYPWATNNWTYFCEKPHFLKRRPPSWIILNNLLFCVHKYISLKMILLVRNKYIISL